MSLYGNTQSTKEAFMKGWTQPIESATETPNELLEVDFIGRIENLRKNNKFVLVCIDHFSKLTEVKVIPKKYSKEILKALT